MDTNLAAFWQVILAVLNLSVLFATLVTLIFYTKYTYHMQRAVNDQARIAAQQTQELIHQRRLSVLPAFVLVPQEPRYSNRMNLNNVGKGVALNVVMDDVPVSHQSYPAACIVFPPMPFIRPGQEVNAVPNYSGLGDGNQQNEARNSPPVQNYLNDREYTLTVRFLDIEGSLYIQTLTMSHGKCTPSPVKLAPKHAAAAAERRTSVWLSEGLTLARLAAARQNRWADTSYPDS